MLMALAHLDTEALSQSLLWVLIVVTRRLTVGMLGDEPSTTAHKVQEAFFIEGSGG